MVGNISVIIFRAMHRDNLLRQLLNYTPFDDIEDKMYVELIQFVREHPHCFERSCPPGHITGSAWIVDKCHTHALLTHHRKLDRWLQLGGHADGEFDILGVAMREAREESGIESITPLTGSIYDVDIHIIPARNNEPQHLHYDVRYLLMADKESPLIISSESKNLSWVPLENITQLNQEPSMQRMVSKLDNQLY